MKNVKSIDLETTGFEAYKGDLIFAYVICDLDLDSRVYRFDNISERKNKVAHTVFTKFIRDTSIIKLAHNASFEMGFIAEYNGGILPPGKWEDTIIMSQLLRNLIKSHALDDLCKRYFEKEFPEEFERWDTYDKAVKHHLTTQKRLFNNYPERFKKEIIEPLIKFDKIMPLRTDKYNYGLVRKKTMTEYQISDGERNMLLYHFFYPKIKADRKLLADYKNEIRLLKTSQKMEQRGMMVHLNNSHELIEDLKIKVEKLSTKKKKIFGFNINLDSSDQLQKHLFGYINPKKHDKLDHIWKRKAPRFKLNPVKYTEAGAPSTDKESLQKLIEKYPKKPILDLLLRYRAYTKGVTMIEKYITLAGKDLIIHPNINTNKAATGRQSVSNPSLQNVSKEIGNTSVYGIAARKCFRPRPGYVLLLGDYAGIEMRLIISASGEEELIYSLQKNIDYDVHTFNAKIIYGDLWKHGSEVAKKRMRTYTKTALFGLAYGANAATIGFNLHLTLEQTRTALRNYAARCPHIFNFCRNKMNLVKSDGFIVTAFGRRLDIYRDQAYAASNYQIQGDAAGTLKRGQNNSDEYIINQMKGDYNKLALLLTVHDEQIFEMHRSLLPQKDKILKDLNECMTKIPEIAVPLATEWKIATTNWHEAKGI